MNRYYIKIRYARIFLFATLLIITVTRVATFLASDTISQNLNIVKQQYSTKDIVQLNAIVISYPEDRDNSRIFFAVLESGYKIRVTTSKNSNIDYGDLVLIEGKISFPRNFVSDNGKEFDYINYLAKDDVFIEMKNAKLTVNTGWEGGVQASVLRDVNKKLFVIKRWFTGNIRDSLPEPHSSLANGLVVGEKSSLGTDLLNSFRDSGLVHIIVLSGFNITIIGLSIRRLMFGLPRRWGILLGGLALCLFGVMVGGGATVVRSCVMAVTALCSEYLYRPYSAWVGIVIAGLLMVIHNPSILFHDPSFQLSFLATLGLMLFSNPLKKILSFVPEDFGLKDTISSTIATQITVTPLLIHMMGEISVVGTFVNILVLPVIPILMLFIALLGLFPFISELIVPPTFFLLEYILKIVGYASILPWAVVRFDF